MDIAKRDALLHLVGYDGVAFIHPRLVSLEAFFDGRGNADGIWCNLEKPPESQSDAFACLRGIRERHDVSDVRMLVTQFDGFEGEWPFSDTVVVLTETNPDTVAAWSAEYPPDEWGDESDKIGKQVEDKSYVWLWWD
jgi:hypothetical protein